MSASNHLTRVEAARYRRRRPRHRRRIAIALLVLVALLAVPVYSYTTTMLQPSTLPLGVRSVEWLRTHYFRWLVNDVERLYYKSTAPKKGGPQLRTLPTLPTATPPPRRRRPRHVAAIYQPPRVRPMLHPAIGAEGVWQPAGPTIRGTPA